MALVAALTTVCASASAIECGHHDLTQMRYRTESGRVFKDSRSHNIDRCNEKIFNMRSQAQRAAVNEDAPSPVFTAGPVDNMGDLDAPGGELWFYTADFVYDEIPPHDNVAFTEYILREYTFNIYDSSLSLVGTVRDKMAYREGEVRVPSCDLAPIVTRNFFNTDDKYEVVVSVAVNAAPGTNRYSSLIYQIGGEKTDEGYDKIIKSYDKLIGDVAEAPSSDGRDNYYVTFIDESSDDVSGSDEPLSFWDSLLANKATVEIYTRAEAGGEPTVALAREIPVIQLPGDQESTPLMISLRRGDDLYFMFQYYAEPFYNRYDDPITDELSQREGNKLDVEMWKVQPDGTIAHEYTTEIPVVIDDNPDVIASYYSVGNLRYREDINFTGYGTPAGRAALYVTRQNYIPSSDGYVNSYYLYDHEGKLLKTIFGDCDSALSMSDVPGHERQHMFVTRGGSGYLFHFVDLISCKTVLTIDYSFEIDEDSEPEVLTANLDRVASGDSYMYVDELRVPSVDENENDIMRFIWIDSKGAFSHIDEVNMGSKVMYAKSFLYSGVLKPGVYSTSGNMAYMLLVKRGTSGTGNQEELLIGEALSEEHPQGKTLLLACPDERGVLSSINLFPGAEDSRLFVTYYDQHSRTISADFYHLPLDETNGIGAVVIPGDTGSIQFDGSTAVAEGVIKVYNAAGVQVAAGTDRVELGHLQPGLYLVSSTESTLKIIIK